MKKIVSFLLLATTISFGACKRDGCWKCTTTETNEIGEPNGAVAKFTECGKNEVEIRRLEKERSGTQVLTTSSGKAYKSTAVTTCK